MNTPIFVSMPKRREGEYLVKTWGEGFNSVEEWSLNGLTHREDGPAMKHGDGRKEWWLDNMEYSEREWIIEMRKRKLEALGI